MLRLGLKVALWGAILFVVVFPCLLAAEDEPDLELATDDDSLRQSAELPEENQEDLSSEIDENSQTALSLKRLLLGRSHFFFGRIEVDAALYSGHAFEGENGGEVRRFRVGIAGILSDHLSYKGELDLTDKSTTVSDFYLKIDTSLKGSLTVGNQLVSQNLSAMTGTRSQLFMEYPLPVKAFSLSRRLGVSHDYHTNRWGGHGMIFFRDPNNDAGDKGWALRAFINPTRTGGGIAHLGFSAVREKMSGEARYRTRPESHVTDIRLVDTGQFQDVDYQNILGLEAAGALGSFTGRMEALRSTWDRTGGSKNDFYGAYLELGYFLTGQDFNYRQGKFVRPKLDEGTRAWEIGFRASWVDLNDKEIQGGEQLNLGLALNYYLKQNFRIQSNLLHLDSESTAGNENSWIVQARIQYNW